MKIYIANDHAGYDLKVLILAHLEKRGLEYLDCGCGQGENVRYPIYGAKAAAAVSKGDTDRAILVCGTGIGMSILANKYPNVRASLCTTVYMGGITRAHNDSNILCLGGRTTQPDLAIEILDAWLDTAFEGGRHGVSLDMVKAAEEQNRTGQVWEGIKI